MSKHRTRTTRWSRLLSGVLCLALMLGLMPAAGLVQSAEAHWADPYGEQLVDWGVMMPSSNLRLSSTITRAEFVAMCNRAFGYHKLGGTPFTDVRSSAWYAQDIDIAYNAGYFMGTSGTTASPNGTLTREQAAVLVARNLMLQETVGEVIDFTDSHSLSDWSRGLIGAAVAEGMVSGLPDGSFSPSTNISRGEVAAMLVRAIGNPISKAGSYEMGDVYGNVTISSSDVTLRNTVILGNLYVTGGVDLGNVLLENVTVLGRIVVAGGGESHAGQSSVVLRNVAADEMVIDSIIDQFVTVSAYGLTDIPATYVRSNSYLEDASEPGYGLQYIELDGDPGTKLQLAGSIKEVVNKTPFSTLQLAQGTAEKITIDEYAVNSQLILDINTRVDELNLDVATLVYGEGDITDLNISAADCDVEILPGKVTIRPGITATVGGELIDSNGAAELSSEPRLLAGYPKVTKLTPTQVEAQFSGNKPGTIYYAVSELADGSVSEENLIDNPAYGGNIYQGQAGSIAAASSTVYSRDITKLQPDGSYYLSAIMVDGRGMRSPLKVISFTTPDNTVPQFLNGYISLETCDIVQLTGMPNKSCTLYWVLLEAGAAAPTAQNFKSGSFGGHYGSGTINVTKNVPISITVNSFRLMEDTNYVLYVWLNDFDGAQSSIVYNFPVHAPDETPPVPSTPFQSGYGESTAEVTFSINEYPSTLFWAVVVEGNTTFITPDADLTGLAAQVKVVNGTKAGAIVSGSTPADGANIETLIRDTVLKGLDYATYKTHSFKFYYVARDAAGNYSAVDYIIIHTLDTDPPTAWLDFSDYVGEDPKRPRANSDIMIVFSEQVKGGASTKDTFMDLYEQVKYYQDLGAGYTSQLNTAKSALADALKSHIELYYIPTTGRPQPVSTSPAFGDGGDSDWVNFANAVLELRSDGCLVITLPGDGGNDVKAINLRSGATYQFQLKGVYDNAITPNGMAGDHGKDASGKDIADTNGNFVSGLFFTTVYAQVELYENTSVSSTSEGSDGVRLDLVVDVVPQSTEKVPDTEYWDLIMWSQLSISFDIYRQINDGEWVKMNTDHINIDPPGITGTSLRLRKTYEEGPDVEKVKTGLAEGTTYRYGIHLHSIGDVVESSETATPDSWSDMVVMRFSLIAGTSGHINTVSNGVDKNYNSSVSSGDVSEIGIVYTRTGTETILTCSKQFVDTKAPSFQSGYPTFTAGSGMFTMRLGLDRPGTVYYVVAPVGEITTQIDANTAINADTDGSKHETVNQDGTITEKDTKAGWLNDLTDKTYIPTGGPDREKDAHKGHIHFYNNTTPYDQPTYRNIVAGKSTYPSSEVQAGSVDVGAAITTINITGLRPTQEYYVYFVLQGGGDPSHVVEIYRVTTTEVQVPSVLVTGTTTTATITPSQDSQISIALVEYNSLPSDIRGDGGTNTVLAQMINRADNNTEGPSEFDNTTGNDSLKANVAAYIRGTGAGTTTSMAGQWTLPGVGPDHKTYTGAVGANTSLTFNFEEYMTSTSSEYVVLVVARHIYGGTGGSDFGFGAARGLYTPDKVPPEFVNSNEIEGYIKGSMRCTNNAAWGDGTWSDNANKYYYSGSVTLDFTKDLYWHEGSTRYKIVYSDAGTGEKNLTELLTGSAVGYLDKTKMAAQTGAVGSSITLYFANMPSTADLTFPSSGKLCNASDYTTDKKLRLNFDAMLRQSNFNKGVYADTYWPGFRVRWS